MTSLLPRCDCHDGAPPSRLPTRCWPRPAPSHLCTALHTRPQYVPPPALLSQGRRCSHCSKHSNTLRPDSGSKIFVTALSSKLRAHNQGLSDTDLGVQRGAFPAASDDEDEDEDEDEDGEAAGEGGGAAAPTTSQRGAATAATEGTAKGGQSVMTPAVAKRLLERLWRTEGTLLRRMFPELRASSFFQSVVCVPPNRFRPPGKVGDQVFEHSQNVWLGQILALNGQVQLP